MASLIGAWGHFCGFATAQTVTGGCLSAGAGAFPYWLLGRLLAVPPSIIVSSCQTLLHNAQAKSRARPAVPAPLDWRRWNRSDGPATIPPLCVHYPAPRATMSCLVHPNGSHGFAGGPSFRTQPRLPKIANLPRAPVPAFRRARFPERLVGGGAKLSLRRHRPQRDARRGRSRPELATIRAIGRRGLAPASRYHCMNKSKRGSRRPANGARHEHDRKPHYAHIRNLPTGAASRLLRHQ